jgi:hypothetical protein
MTLKEKIEVILIMVIIFLSALFIFTVINGGLSIFITIGALSLTYIIIHYWEKRFLKKKQQRMK